MALDDGLGAYLLTIPWRRQPDGSQRRQALSEVLEDWGRPVDANALARWLSYRHRADTIEIVTDQWHDVQVRARDAWDGTDVMSVWKQRSSARPSTTSSSCSGGWTNCRVPRCPS